MLDRIEANSKRLLALINDILDIAKIEAGRMELVAQPFAPRALCETWQAQMAVLAEQKNLQFDIFVADDVPEVLYGDEGRITQIAINLLSNAFKFTEQGGVALTMAWEDALLTPNWVIQVRDTGTGISEDFLTVIFDEFRQVDSSTRRSYGGTGLGLAIVRNLCTLMRGTVTVESVVGVGSTFTVTLPLPTEEPAHGEWVAEVER
jgi:signal transduction histidine kinase